MGIASLWLQPRKCSAVFSVAFEFLEHLDWGMGVMELMGLVLVMEALAFWTANVVEWDIEREKEGVRWRVFLGVGSGRGWGKG